MNKYRLGKKQKRAILEVETGREYLVFPDGKTEHVEEFLNFLNNKTKMENKEKFTNFIKKWNVGHESKEQEKEFADEMFLELTALYKEVEPKKEVDLDVLKYTIEDMRKCWDDGRKNKSKMIETINIDFDDFIQHLPHLQEPVEIVFTLEDMYLLSSHVVDCIAANRGNSDWNMNTTPKMIADDYIKTLPLQKDVHSNIMDELIEAAKYGYEFRDTTSFPKHKFEDSCINNFKQLLQSKGYKV